jgi:hypothetical protein
VRSKLFKGEITHFARPSANSKMDQLYHVMWEDGDEQVGLSCIIYLVCISFFLYTIILTPYKTYICILTPYYIPNFLYMYTTQPSSDAQDFDQLDFQRGMELYEQVWYCAYICIYAYICLCVCVCVCVRAGMVLCIYVGICVCICVFVCMH